MNKILPKNIIIKSLTLMINKSLKYKEERHNTYIDIPENIDSRLKKNTMQARWQWSNIFKCKENLLDFCTKEKYLSKTETI